MERLDRFISAFLVGAGLVFVALAGVCAVHTVEVISAFRHEQVCRVIDGSQCVQCVDGLAETVRCTSVTK